MNSKIESPTPYGQLYVPLCVVCVYFENLRKKCSFHHLFITLRSGFLSFRTRFGFNVSTHLSYHLQIAPLSACPLTSLLYTQVSTIYSDIAKSIAFSQIFHTIDGAVFVTKYSQKQMYRLCDRVTLWFELGKFVNYWLCGC